MLREATTAIALIAALGAAGCDRSRHAEAADRKNAPVVGVARVKRGALTRTLEITAEFRPYQDVDVHAKVSGYVREINVDVGDRVHAGQLLATLEIPELADEVKQADASVRLSEKQIQRAQDDLERTESEHHVAHLAYQRLSAVMKTQPGLIAQQDLDDAQGRDRSSEAQRAAAQAALAASQQQLALTQANQERLSTLFAYSRITAPFNGVITVRYADKGSMIQAGTSSQTQAMPLVRLAENDRLRLVIPVPESVVPLVHLGSRVEVQVQSLGKTFTGKVSRFADQVDMATRTMHTEVDVPNPQFELVPGMYASVVLALGTREGVLTVPVGALHPSESSTTVYVVNTQNRIEERTVKVGVETPREAEILSGLNEGELVVIGGGSRAQPGLLVQPKAIAPGSGEGGE